MNRLAAQLSVVCLLAASLAVPGVTFAQDPLPLLAPLSDGRSFAFGEDELDPNVPSPSDFLGYPLGSRFTHHHRVLDYLAALSSSSDRVLLERYGSSYEDRPLVLAVISAPENLARLDEIRQRHLELALPDAGSSGAAPSLDGQPVVVWLAYGVHGNESSSTEAALATAYLLAAGRGETAERLRNTLVLIDPLSNPDGRERYVSAFEQRRGRVPSADPEASEHFEPWPGGRQNHYLIDLNRDWAWASQRETRDRLAAYRRWEPQVYVDLHEMGRDSTYFFPPSADPIHPRITDPVVGWLETFGRGNARAFDERGFLYYKAENFDLFYPGYGDSYPALRGSVGMTYEMAGGGRAGQTVYLGAGRTLTLSDRIARHLTASMTTVETAAAHHRKLLEDFAASRRPSAQGPEVTYLWRPDDPEAHELAALLAFHGVRVQRLDGERTLSAHLGNEPPRVESFARDTYAVSTRQPLGRLAAALLERHADMPETFLDRQRQRVDEGLRPEFYDITGWSLPLAFNLPVWEVDGTPVELTESPTSPRATITGEGDLGLLLPPAGLASFRIEAHLQRQWITYYQALEPFEISETSYPAGTLFVPRQGNPSTLLNQAVQWANENQVTFHRVGTSFTTEGISLGSDRMMTVRPSTVGLVGGPGVSPTSFGALWHLLDRDVALSMLRLDVDRLGRTGLSEIDVLVLPDGSYDDSLGEKGAERLGRWIDDGGTLVAVGDAVEWLQSAGLTSVRAWGDEPKEKDDGDDYETRASDDAGTVYTPGAIVATDLRTSHPLAAGLPSSPPVLVTGGLVLQAPSRPGQSVLTVREEEPLLSGFAWPEAEERLAGSLLVSAERRGDGQIVLFAQHPAYRVFWRGTMPLFLNAVMHGPSWLDD